MFFPALKPFFMPEQLTSILAKKYFLNTERDTEVMPAAKYGK